MAFGQIGQLGRLGQLGGGSINAPLQPQSLFTDGEAGIYLYPQDTASLFQDAAGTIPAVAEDDPVGLILDKSGNGNHAYQTVSTKRALLKYTDSGVLGLYFDGVDDCYVTNAIDFGATDEMVVFAGVQKRSAIDGSADSVCELSAAFDSNNGTFAVGAPGISKEFSYITKGTLIGRADATNRVLYAIPDPFVLTGESKISTDTCQLSLNGELVQATTLDQGTGNYGNYPLNIGSRNSSSTFFNGFLSALIIRGKTVQPFQKSGITQWISLRQRGYESLPAIGVPYGGGYVAGYISVAGNGIADHMLIVSPKASGETWLAWDTVGDATTGFTSLIDGPTNSAGLAALGSQYAAATFCEGLTINGYSDWYLPARNELEVAYYNLKNVTQDNYTGLSGNKGNNPNAVPPWEPVSTTYTATRPAQTTVTAFKVGGVEAFANGRYWSSSEEVSLHAWINDFTTGWPGLQGYGSITSTWYVRAFRRLAI